MAPDAAVGVVRAEDVMAKRVNRPNEYREPSQVVRNAVIGSVILVGAVLWGYAVFHVAMRTM